MDPVDNPLNYRLGTFYYNPGDLRLIVPKRARALGRSLNFAHPRTMIFLTGVAVMALLSLFFPGLGKI